MIEKNWMGTFIDTDLHPRFDEIKQSINHVNRVSWRNDKVLLQLLIQAGNEDVKDIDYVFKSSDRSIQQGIKIFNVHFVEAFKGFAGYGSVTRDVPQGNRVMVPDALIPYATTNLEATNYLLLWIELVIPENAKLGFNECQLNLQSSNEKKELIFTITIEVLHWKLPSTELLSETFDMELWQNPYAVAEYYDVIPFSDRHFSILKPHMVKYKESGGCTLTATLVDDAWAGQTYSKNEIKFPSMIQWIKKLNGQFEYDFTDFEKWITFNHELGIGEKIVAYGVVPWSGRVRYYDEATQSYQTFSVNYQETETRVRLTHFLSEFKTFLSNHHWLSQTYLGVDERGFNMELFNIVNELADAEEDRLKIAGAMDGFVDKFDIALRIDDLSVGTIAIKENREVFNQLLQKRKALGLKTSVYSCTGHIPGNFTLSAPVESYWTLLFTLSVGGEGFLRWAYDSWVENPLKDSTHNAFEAGDTFLIYPDKKDSEHPISNSSVRFEKLIEGWRDVQKLLILKEYYPTSVERLLQKLKMFYPVDFDHLYLSEEGKDLIAKDMQRLRKMIEKLSRLEIMVNEHETSVN